MQEEMTPTRKSSTFELESATLTLTLTFDLRAWIMRTTQRFRKLKKNVLFSLKSFYERRS